MDNFKSGYVAIVGRPNVGKSTILNALMGTKISIISSKPQTTRNKILAIMSDSDSQVVFLDTPGFHKPKNKLGENMMKSLDNAVGDVDLVLMVVEPTLDRIELEKSLIEKLSPNKCILVINKIDTIKKENLLSVISEYSKLYNFEEIVPVSAKSLSNIDLLRNLIKDNMAIGPMYYPDDMITDSTERELVAEIIREKMLYMLDKEVPHGIAIEIVKMKHRKKDGSDIYDINANIYCEKSSHKGIIIGQNGKTLKEIGTKARIDAEKLLNSKVFMELWVKVKSDWRNSNSMIKEFGLSEN